MMNLTDAQMTARATAVLASHGLRADPSSTWGGPHYCGSAVASALMQEVSPGVSAVPMIVVVARDGFVSITDNRNPSKTVRSHIDTSGTLRPGDGTGLDA